jgi:hypothetical protein
MATHPGTFTPKLLWRQVLEATIDTLEGRSRGQYHIGLARPPGIEAFFEGLPRVSTPLGGYTIEVPLAPVTKPEPVPASKIEVAYLGPESRRRDWRIPSQRPETAYPLWRSGVGLLDTTRPGEDYVVLVRDPFGAFHARWLRGSELERLPATLANRLRGSTNGVEALGESEWPVIAEILHLPTPATYASESLAPRRQAIVESVPVEGGSAEGYEVSTVATVKQARRREHELVRRFEQHLQSRGCEVTRNRITPTGAAGSIYTDLFNQTRAHLIEAKASATRNDVRMAIGQLADYGRFVPEATRHAVLLGERPEADLLELLKSCGLGAIWWDGDTFLDSAGGELV